MSAEPFGTIWWLQTWPIKVAPSADVEDNPFDSKKYSLAVRSVKRCQGLWCVRLIWSGEYDGAEQGKHECLVKHSWRVRLWHPRITVSEVVRNCRRRAYGRKENGIHAIDDVEHESGIYWVSDGESHYDGT